MSLSNDLLIQRPAQPAELVLLFHGVGADADDLQPVGEAIARARPQALVVSVRGPDASDLGRGRQWFSVIGVTEDSRPARLAATMPRFLARVRDWQQAGGVGPEATTLVGFSQGAILSLQATQAPEPVAGRVIAIAGRFAEPPRVAPAHTRVRWLHGDADPVMPVALGESGVAQLRALGADATLERFAGLGHGIDARALASILRGLSD